MAIVALGFSSMIQWPESGITPSVTSLAANRITVAIIGPNDFSPPIASTGMPSLPLAARKAWLSSASWSKAANCAKPAVHRARQRVQLGVMLTRGLGEAAGRRGKLVPEAVEVDALAARDEALHVGPAEPEVPQQRVLQDLLPRADPRHRSVDQNEARHPLRVLHGEGVADHVADIVRDEIGAIDLERVENARHVAGLGLLVVSRGRFGGQAEAAQVRHHDGMVAREILGHRRPHVAGLAIAVQQDDRRTLAADANMDRGAVGLDLLRLEAGRERLHLRRCRQCDSAAARTPITKPNILHLPHRTAIVPTVTVGHSHSIPASSGLGCNRGTGFRKIRTMMKLDGIVAFVAVAQAGSISEAARRLSLSKSVVSDRLTELERSLGVSLVHRSTRKLTLTEDGVPSSNGPPASPTRSSRQSPRWRERRGELVGPLRISAPVTFGRMHLGPAIYPFLAKNPGIELTLDLDDRRVDATADGYDAVVRHGPLAESRLMAWRLAPSRRVLVASPDYLARHGVPASLADLDGHRGIFYTNRGVEDWRFSGPDGATIVRGRSSVAGEQRRHDAGRRAGRDRHRPPADVHRRSRNQGRPPAGCRRRRPPEPEFIYVAHLDGRRPSAKLRAFADCLREAFGDPPYWELVRQD